jgi:RecB family exonuclease
VQTQAALKQMSDEEREAVLARAVDDALSRHRPGGGDPAWPRAYIDTERERLRLLLGPWLEFEMTRKAFAVKLREEKLTGVQIGPLRLDVRVDRVDELVNEDGEPGGEVILDYKTGSAAPASWLGPRPDQPQLPLYAVVSEPQRLAAVGFALVRRGEGMEITGYEEIEGALLNAKNFKKESLEAQVDEWREVLTSLASNFRAGLATVAPKRYPQTCAYCEQRLLCRLQPSTLEPEALEDQDAPESDPDSPANDFADGEAAFG